MNELYKKYIIKKLERTLPKETIDSLEKYNEEQRFQIMGLIDGILDRLSLTTEEDIISTIMKFEEENEKIGMSMEELRNKILNNYKEIYGSIMEKL